MHDPVNKPIHYASGGIECIEAIEEAVKDLAGMEAVYTSQILKYTWRWKKKNGLEDLNKAKFYLERLIKSLETSKYKPEDYGKINYQFDNESSCPDWALRPEVLQDKDVFIQTEPVTKGGLILGTYNGKQAFKYAVAPGIIYPRNKETDLGAGFGRGIEVSKCNHKDFLPESLLNDISHKMAIPKDKKS